MEEFQQKVDALDNEVAHWEKDLQALQEIVSKTRQIREELHKGGLGDLVFSDILDVAKGFDGAEESFVKKVGVFLDDLSNFRKKLTKFHDNIQASHDDYVDLCQSIPTNAKFQELRKLEADVEKGLKSFQEEVRDADEEWNKRYSKITNTRDRFREMLDELPLEPEESMPSIQYAETIDEDIKKIKEAVNKLDLVSFISEGSALKDQWTTIQAKIDSRSSPWDSALIGLIEQLDGKKKSLEQKPAKLERFAQERDLELIWPKQGDKYSPEDHQISDEREDSQVDRGHVIRFVTPGLRRGTEVIVKAGILLAK